MITSNPSPIAFVLEMDRGICPFRLFAGAKLSEMMHP